MLDSKDLRIGNYYLNEENKLTELSGYYLWQLSVKEHHKSFNQISEEFKPIPISEEWLIRFGFVKYGKLHDSYRLNPFIVELGILGNHYTFRKIMNRDESVLLKEMKYVHELQNLFRELKGKELELKT